MVETWAGHVRLRSLEPSFRETLEGKWDAAVEMERARAALLAPGQRKQFHLLRPARPSHAPHDRTTMPTLARSGL